MTGRVNGFIGISKKSFRLLRKTEPLVLSSSTAFFATFSLSPILILIVNLFGLFFKSERIYSQLFTKIGAAIGTETALEFEKIFKNFMKVEKTWWMTIAGSVLFIFIATTLLGVVKQNIHKLWRIKKGAKKFRFQFKERIVMAGLILSTGVLFLVSILIDSALALSFDYLQTIVPKAGIFIIQFLNVFFSIIVVTIWFTLLFKFLPQATVQWDVAFTGAFLTAALFAIGRFALGKILIHARIATFFGASASFALLLLFIFYCSFILYYGAAFTHEYGEFANKHISAGKNAHEYEEKLLPTNLKLQEKA
jgi:membrane protein